MGNKILLAAIVTIMSLLAIQGCNEEQQRQIDQLAVDVNAWTDAGRGVLESPAAQMIPPPIGLIAASAIAIASGAANGWQKYRGNQMKKTTKAIVRGIEASGNPDKATSEVKANIANAMRLEGGEKFYKQANKIVDTLKVGG